eukprot:gene6948-7728_t
MSNFELYEDSSDPKSRQYRDRRWIYEFYPEGAERQAQLERALREKAAVEKELEKLYNEGPSEVSRAGMTLEDLQKRLSRLEVSRDEAVLHADSLQSSLRRTESQTENEKNYMKSQITELRKRVKTLESEVENVSNSRLQLLDEIDKQKREVILVNQQKDDIETKASAEISLLRQKLEIQKKDVDSRIRATDNLNRQTVNELREMLTAQQRVGNKWRDESRSMTQKFESTINELKQDSGRIERKHDEILKKFIAEQERAEKVKLLHMEQELMTSRLSQNDLQRIAADAEARADAASTQVKTLLSRERQLLQERKELNKELDRLKLETSRPSSRNQNQWKFLDNETPHKDDYRRPTNGYFS